MKQTKKAKETQPVIEVEENEEFTDIVTLELEDGTTEDCEILDFLEVKGKQYVALQPLEKEDYYIFEYIEQGEDSDIKYIEDDEEFEIVSEAFAEYFELAYDDDELDDDEEYELYEEEDEEDEEDEDSQ